MWTVNEILTADEETLPDTHIYALVDPRDNQIRYIGQTKDIMQRYGQHLQSPPPGPMAIWIITLCKMEMLPIMIILDCVLKISAWKIESDWIQICLNQGHILFNRNRGGKRLSLDEIISQEPYPPCPSSQRFPSIKGCLGLSVD